MTVESQYQPDIDDGDGVTTAFPVTFRFDNPADVKCIVYAVDGTPRIPAYTVTGHGYPGGTVTITDPAPASGEQVVRYRETELTQRVNYTAGNFPSEAHERAADRLTMTAQERARIDKITLRMDERSDPIGPIAPVQTGFLLMRTAEGFGPGPAAEDVDAALGYSQAAATSAGEAAAARDVAAGHASAADASAAAAADSKTAAAGHVTEAAAEKDAAAGHATNAAGSATAAAGHVTDAAAEKDAAAGHATNAAGSATAASGFAGDAAASATGIATTEARVGLADRGIANAGFEAGYAGLTAPPLGWEFAAREPLAGTVLGHHAAFVDPASEFKSSLAYGAPNAIGGGWWKLTKWFACAPGQKFQSKVKVRAGDNGGDPIGVGPTFAGEDDLFIETRFYGGDGAQLSLHRAWTAAYRYALDNDGAIFKQVWYDLIDGEKTAPAGAAFMSASLIAVDGDNSSKLIGQYETWSVGNCAILLDDYRMQSSNGGVVEITQAVKMAAASAAEAAAAAVGEVSGKYMTSQWVAGTAADFLPDVVETFGYHYAGDFGGAIWRKVGSEPAHAAKIQMTGGAVTSWYELAMPHITPQMLGHRANQVNSHKYGTRSELVAAQDVAGGGGHADNIQVHLQTCLEASFDLQIPVYLAGHNRLAGRCYYPLDNLGDATARSWGLNLEAHPDCAPQNCTLQYTTTDSGICPEGMTFDATTGAINLPFAPNSQAHNASLKGITFVGRMVPLKYCFGVILVNTRTPVVEKCQFEGFTDGAGLVLYAINRGGMYRPTIRDCNLGHHNYLPGQGIYSEDRMLRVANGRGVWVYTSTYSGGKVNDLVIDGLYGNMCIETAVCTEPFPVAGSDVYGPGNIVIENHFDHPKQIREFRSGTMARNGSDTAWTLTFDASHVSENFAPHSGIVYLLEWFDPAFDDWTTRQIATHSGNNVTITSAFGNLPPNGTPFFIRFTTARIHAANNANSYPRAVDLQSDMDCRIVNANYEGHRVPIVFGPQVKRVILDGCRLKVNQENDYRMLDGSRKITVAVTIYPNFDEQRLGDGSMNGLFQGSIGLQSDAGYAVDASDAGFSNFYEFVSTGASLTYGGRGYVAYGRCVYPLASDGIETGRTSGRIKLRESGAGGHALPRLVVGGMADKYFNGSYVQVARPGDVRRALVSGSVAAGDRLEAGPNGTWRVNNSGPELNRPLIAEAAGTDGNLVPVRVLY